GMIRVSAAEKVLQRDDGVFADHRTMTARAVTSPAVVRARMTYTPAGRAEAPPCGHASRWRPALRSPPASAATRRPVALNTAASTCAALGRSSAITGSPAACGAP